MYYQSVQQFARTLRNLDAIMSKAEDHAKARNFDVNNFVGARIAPDMLNFTLQVRIACDNAKVAGALLAGKVPPKHDDTETTFADLRGRVAKCLAFLETLTAADFAKTQADTLVKLPYPAGKGMGAEQFLWSRQVPNFYFHVVTAYDILRAGGVDIGKTDYLGALETTDL